MNNLILIVDDEPDIRELLEITLGRMKLNTHAAATIEAAKQLLKKYQFTLCLTDLHLPDGNGIELVQYIQDTYPDTPIAVITAFGSMETAISALKAGAFDYLSKPVELNQLREIVNNAIKLEHTNDQEKHNIANTQISGQSPCIQSLNLLTKKLARSQAAVYISGESGSGKELVARQIHALSPRKNNPFIPVNCGAIPSELMESEFFGHKKGSFTGAVEDKIGLFQAAHSGTLFLDEVADLPLSMQVKLLRAIQEKKIRPVGSQKEIAVDVRLLSATHKDLYQLVHQERFRQDLYYRINVIQVNVPALRDRIEDIQALSNTILNKLCKHWEIPCPSLTKEALEKLKSYSYPGNVRELENILERTLTLSETKKISAEHVELPQHNGTPLSNENSAKEDSAPKLPVFDTSNTAMTLEQYLNGIEHQIILETLNECRWHRTQAAKQLGMSMRSLRYRMEKLEIVELPDSKE